MRKESIRGFFVGIVVGIETILKKFSNIIALCSLIISVFIGYSADQLAKKANEMTNHAMLLKIEKFNLTVVNFNERDESGQKKHFIRAANELISGAQIDISGELSWEYGNLSRLYLVERDVEEDKVRIKEVKIKNVSKNVVQIEGSTFIEEKGVKDRINQHFYLIAIDESRKMHRLMFEVTSKKTYISEPPSDVGPAKLSLHIYPDGENDVYYRKFSDFDLLQYATIQLNSNWSHMKNEGSEHSNSYYVELPPEKVVKEIIEINELFAMYGFE